MHFVITGANGFIGSALAAVLIDQQHEVTALVRSVEAARAALPAAARILPWGNTSDEWREAVGACDIVVHLAGASLGGRRWTPEVKKILCDSRIARTRAVVDAMRESGRRDQVLISGSAVGYYGDGGDRVLTEADPPGEGFLSNLCVEWEAEARGAEEFGSRVVLLRTGIVLGEGGALEKMLPPFRLGVGGPLGSGRQWMSWIHREDAVAMIAWAAENRAARGPLNVTAPEPVTMREFARALGRALRRPSLFPVPAFALRLLLGEFANALLTGQRAMPKAAQTQGFAWKFPELEPALRSILTKPNRGNPGG
jgi:uncharacterized protein (TIGR01777 family)